MNDAILGVIMFIALISVMAYILLDTYPSDGEK